MNCSGETDSSTHLLRKVCSDPDLRFDISTPLVVPRTFQPSFPLTVLFDTEADSSSWIQFSLANCTYLFNDSSLIDLSRIMTKLRLYNWSSMERRWELWADSVNKFDAKDSSRISCSRWNMRLANFENELQVFFLSYKNCNIECSPTTPYLIYLPGNVRVMFSIITDGKYV